MLDEHFFRHNYAELVAALLRKFGVQHLTLVEDAAQTSLLKALELWPHGLPKQPKAWLYRVAHNAFIDELRRRQPLDYMGDDWLEQLDEAFEPRVFDRVVQDDLLHLIFVCCDESVPEPSRLVIALKVLCGFSVTEIAQRLFMTPANVYKRYQRARKQLASQAEYFNQLSAIDAAGRLPSVLKVIYSLFSEGYLSVQQSESIRRDLCDDAMRLAALLESKLIEGKPRVYALQALMAFNYARLDSREEVDKGGLLLLEEQVREDWNTECIAKGFDYLARSAVGEDISRYHLEAAIAAEHCRAQSYDTTRWAAICGYYAQLEQLFPSYLYRLNRVVALAEWQGPKAGLFLLEEQEPPTWMSQSYLWLAVAADLRARCGHLNKANSFYRLALECAPNEAIKQLIRRRQTKYLGS